MRLRMDEDTIIKNKIIEHIEHLDETIGKLRRDKFDRTDSYCSLMNAKSTALLALTNTKR